MTFQFTLLFLIFINNFNYLRADYSQDYIDYDNQNLKTEETSAIYFNVKTPSSKTESFIILETATETESSTTTTTKSSTKTEPTITTVKITKTSSPVKNATATSMITSKSNTVIIVTNALTSYTVSVLTSTGRYKTEVTKQKPVEVNRRKEVDLIKTYEGYSIISIKPTSPEQLQEILAFELAEKDYIFWSHRRVLESPLNVVLPRNERHLRLILREHRVDYTIVLENFPTSLHETNEDQEISSVLPPLPSLIAISFNMYLRYDFIMDYLKDLCKRYPEIAKMVKIGKTAKKRDITLLEIKGRNSNSRTESVLVEAGMHGREWLGVSVALYTIYRLVEHAAASADMLSGLVWYVLPILNADGYEYSHTNDRYWKNNRHSYGNTCIGVDLDRNFNIGEKTRKSRTVDQYYCTHLYPGERPVSEPETQALVKFIKSKRNMKVYLSLHSGETFIAYPWGYKEQRTTDYEDNVQIAESIKTAIEEIDNSSEFAVGRLNYICGQYDGAAIDWAKHQGVKHPLMISFKGSTSQHFDVTEDELFDTVLTSFAGIKAVSDFLHRPKNLTFIVIRKADEMNNGNGTRFIFISFVLWLIVNVFS